MDLALSLNNIPEAISSAQEVAALTEGRGMVIRADDQAVIIGLPTKGIHPADFSSSCFNLFPAGEQQSLTPIFKNESGVACYQKS